MIFLKMTTETFCFEMIIYRIRNKFVFRKLSIYKSVAEVRWLPHNHVHQPTNNPMVPCFLC